MTLSLYERFLGYDWARYAAIISKGTCLGAAIVGILSILLIGGIWTGVLSIFIALIMALWEFPWIYYCVPKSDVAFKFLQERVHINREEVRCTICIVLSILTYISVSFVILTGLMLDVTALLYIFAAINRIQDQRDGMVSSSTTDVEQPYEQVRSSSMTSGVATSTVTQSLLNASGKFGTF